MIQTTEASRHVRKARGCTAGGIVGLERGGRTPDCIVDSLRGKDYVMQETILKCLPSHKFWSGLDKRKLENELININFCEVCFGYKK